MAKHLDQGTLGEQQALQYLIQHGYVIKETNWRFKHLEIDVIAEDNNMLVFVEVKTRKNKNYGHPIEFVDLAKQQKIIRAADEYIALSGYEGEVRFDIVSVLQHATVEIELVKDAFWGE